MSVSVTSQYSGQIEGRFAPGDAVRVVDADPVGHVRTPHYCRGKTGRVERVCGAFPNPEELAFGRTGLPPRVLYRVRFDQRTLWDEYTGPDDDSVDIEIFEHWLRPASGGQAK